MMLKSLLPKSGHKSFVGGLALGALVPGLCLLSGYGLTAGAPLETDGYRIAMSAAVTAIPFAAAAGLALFSRYRRKSLDEVRLLRSREAELLQNAHHDRLTGLANRFALESDLKHMLQRPISETAREALLLLDLDRFKFVNDTMGHDAGDWLLVALADRLERALASCAKVYRLGGDEFVVLVPGAPSDGKIETICSMLTDLFAEPFSMPSGEFWTAASIGITFRQDGDSAMSALLKRADLALYSAKETPGTSSMFFADEMTVASHRKMEIEHDLTRAIKADEFYLEYQPIVGIESRAIRSFEALVRWRHPVRGTLQPDQFIPLAESTGLILPLGNWIVKTACREAARWPGPTGVAVNVAGDQFRDRAFVGHVRRCLDDAGLAPGRLTIEVTESIFTVDPQIVCDSLAELRSFGVRIALDDFGMGFSSINNLRRFPLDQLKIDRSFTQMMLANKRDAELVDIILKLGNAFQVSTTIEGIETEGQLDFVRGLGAAEAQGFLISRPLPAGEVIALLNLDIERLSAREA